VVFEKMINALNHANQAGVNPLRFVLAPDDWAEFDTGAHPMLHRTSHGTAFAGIPVTTSTEDPPRSRLQVIGGDGWLEV
jgi:hypothetical protein